MKPKNNSENETGNPERNKPSSKQDRQGISMDEGSSAWSRIRNILKTALSSIWIIVMVVGGILAFLVSLFLL